MRGIVVGVLVAALASGCGGHGDEVHTAEPASRRTTTGGDVTGFVGRYGSWVWMGLPYAAPPIGSRRWRAPVAPERWTGVREALRPGAPCVQYASPLGGIQTAPPNTPVGSEDCLYLNVYAPRTATPASRLPVMLWVHGGGNSIGAAHLYDGGNLAATEDVVVVTANYRLGPFGWLRHAALRDGSESAIERSGNFALLDLVRALEWVRDNAAAFGGDPARVTVFGESAGATNVLSLLLVPQARGLFHRAIAESGGQRWSTLAAAERFADDPEPGEPNSSNEMLVRLLVAEGTATDRAAAKRWLAVRNAADIDQWLLAKPAYDVLRAYEPMPGMGMIRLPTAFADGAVLPTEPPPARIARADGFTHVPLLIGTNRDESKLFMFGDPRWVRRWLWIVPRLRDPTGYALAAEYGSRMWKATGADEIAETMRGAGARDVFVYRFDWDEEPTVLGADLAVMLGAAHGFEIPFVFGHFDLGRQANVIYTSGNEPGRKALADGMMSYWTEFAATGSPGRGRRGDLPPWTAWGDARTSIVLDTPAGGGIRSTTEPTSRATVLAAAEQDVRLGTEREHCLVYHDLVMWSGVVTRHDYDAKCPGFAFDAYPWGG